MAENCTELCPPAQGFTSCTLFPLNTLMVSVRRKPCAEAGVKRYKGIRYRAGKKLERKKRRGAKFCALMSNLKNIETRSIACCDLPASNSLKTLRNIGGVLNAFSGNTKDKIKKPFCKPQKQALYA